MLTAIVLTKNEEANISKCLDSLLFCDEIIVCDDHSTDSTRVIAKKYKAKILIHSLESNFAQQRNFALKHASHKWILFVDADEIVSKELATEISSTLPATTKSAFYIHRSDYLWDKRLKHGESGDKKLVRLALKSAGTWHRAVHEFWKVNGNIGEMKSLLLHYPHLNLSDFIQSVNEYAKLHAKENMKEGKSSSIFLILFAPVAKFIQNYVFKLGFLDRTEGIVASLVLSFHSFLAWSNLWLLQRKK